MEQMITHLIEKYEVSREDALKLIDRAMYDYYVIRAMLESINDDVYPKHE